MKLNSFCNWSILVISSLFIITPQNTSLISQEIRLFAMPVWSPDDEYIAFSSKSNDKYEILLIQQNGLIRNLTGEGNEGIVLDIVWSPDGNYLAYTIGNEGKVDIWIAPINDGQPYNLTANMDGLSRNPDWSQDSSRIVFTNGDDAKSDTSDPFLSQIWIIDIETLETVQVTPGTSCASNPQWLSEDSVLLFISLSCDEYTEGLYQYDFNENEISNRADGFILSYAESPSNEAFVTATLHSTYTTDLVLIDDDIVIELATELSLVSDLSWSPNGEHLIMTMNCENGSKVVMFDIESREQSNVTSCADNVYSSNPSWSPDGSALVYQNGGVIWLYNLATQGHSILMAD